MKYSQFKGIRKMWIRKVFCFFVVFVFSPELPGPCPSIPRFFYVKYRAIQNIKKTKKNLQH